MPNSREQFEAANAKAHPVTCTTVANVFERDSEEYTRTTVQVGWVMWQAGAAAEREACAKICEVSDSAADWEIQGGQEGRMLCNDLAKAIRDRSAP